MNNRLSIEEYGCMLTLAGKSRAEDYFTHCGACALDINKRVLGISYNGLKKGFTIPDWMKQEENRVVKNKYMLHAETNLFAMLRKGECHTLCLNWSPCEHCAKNIVAHDVTRVVYLKEYHREQVYKEIFDFYKIEYIELSSECKSNIKQYITDMNNFPELG